ncbi:hypothetical protein D3C75_799770 [compost metagenome]
MKVHYLSDFFQETNEGEHFLLELVFAFADNDEFLYFEYNIDESDSQYSNTIEKFTGKYKQEWFRPRSVQEALERGCDFLIEALVLAKRKI